MAYLYGFGKYEKCYKEEEEGIHKPSHDLSSDIPGEGKRIEGEGGEEGERGVRNWRSTEKD